MVCPLRQIIILWPANKPYYQDALAEVLRQRVEINAWQQRLMEPVLHERLFLMIPFIQEIRFLIPLAWI